MCTKHQIVYLISETYVNRYQTCYRISETYLKTVTNLVTLYLKPMWTGTKHQTGYLISKTYMHTGTQLVTLPLKPMWTGTKHQTGYLISETYEVPNTKLVTLSLKPMYAGSLPGWLRCPWRNSSSVTLLLRCSSNHGYMPTALSKFSCSELSFSPCQPYRCKLK